MIRAEKKLVTSVLGSGASVLLMPPPSGHCVPAEAHLSSCSKRTSSFCLVYHSQVLRKGGCLLSQEDSPAGRPKIWSWAFTFRLCAFGKESPCLALGLFILFCKMKGQDQTACEASSKSSFWK